jgi:hypothetical protein
MNKFCTWLVLLETLVASAQLASLTVSIDAKDGFDTYLSAAVVIRPVRSKTAIISGSTRKILCSEFLSISHY